MTAELKPIANVTGTAVAVRGNDIDTDRIIPARFMKGVTFDGLEAHVFEDVRIDPTSGESLNHPFDDPANAGASILVVNKNFGCGSSREHAPQALTRWGIKGIVGESFAEIFFGNCVSLGIPCVTLPQERVLYLMELVEANPGISVELDVAAAEVIVRERELTEAGAIPDGPQQQFLAGTWDALAVLRSAADQIDETAARLPYIGGYSAS